MNISASSSYKDNAVKLVERPYDLVLLALDGSDYENGELETLSDGISHVHDGFARLIVILLQKGVLNHDDIKKIVEFTWEGK